jgi:hypothetical protein
MACSLRFAVCYRTSQAGLSRTRGEELSAVWRTREFEYICCGPSGRQYAAFWQVTQEALLFSRKSLNLELSKTDSDRLMQSYSEHLDEQELDGVMVSRFQIRDLKPSQPDTVAKMNILSSLCGDRSMHSLFLIP